MLSVTPEVHLVTLTFTVLSNPLTLLDFVLCSLSKFLLIRFYTVRYNDVDGHLWCRKGLQKLLGRPWPLLSSLVLLPFLCSLLVFPGTSLYSVVRCYAQPSLVLSGTPEVHLVTLTFTVLSNPLTLLDFVLCSLSKFLLIRLYTVRYNAVDGHLWCRKGLQKFLRWTCTGSFVNRLYTLWYYQNKEVFRVMNNKQFSEKELSSWITMCGQKQNAKSTNFLSMILSIGIYGHSLGYLELIFSQPKRKLHYLYRMRVKVFTFQSSFGIFVCSFNCSLNFLYPKLCVLITRTLRNNYNICLGSKDSQEQNRNRNWDYW